MIAFPQELISLVASGMRRWRQSRIKEDCGKQITEVEQVDEIEHLAQETGMSVDDLRTLAMLGIHGAYLLRRRMLVLCIDPDGFSRAEPALFRELQKSCSRCDNHGPCAQDLVRDAVDPTRPDWRDYCPNAAWLNTFSALRLMQ